MIVMGARPNFMKVAPLVRFYEQSDELKRLVKLGLVHTGQHYDDFLSATFLSQLGINNIDFFLKVGSGTQAEQTGRVMVAFEQVCISEKPDWVIVVGDVNSTLGCALVAKKLGIKLCHIEAGLRSFNRGMPEEINRIATDSITDLFFTTSEDAGAQLVKEGIAGDDIVYVGNLMIDSLLHAKKGLVTWGKAGLSNNLSRYAILTLHRPQNVDNRDTLELILIHLQEVARRIPILFPCHPRTKNKIEEYCLLKFFNQSSFVLSNPASYHEMISLYEKCQFVMTDSGGIQEETTVLGIPCLTLRDETERPVTVDMGSNTVVGLNFELLEKLVEDILSGNYKRGKRPRYWDGNAAGRVWEALMSRIGEKQSC